MTTNDNLNGIGQLITERGQSKEAAWKEILAKQKESGLTQVEFCRQKGIKKTSFTWWKGKLLGRNGKSRGTKHGRRARNEESAPKRDVAALVPVRVTEAQDVPRAQGMMLEVVLGNNRVLRFPAQFDEQKVARLVSILER